MFQGEGAPSRTPLVPPYAQYPLHSDFAAPRPEQSGRARSRSPPFDAPRASTRHAPRQPPVFEAPPQPSTSGWVPPGPPPPRSRHDSSGSDSGASGSESVTAARDSASARLTDLIYRVCPASRPLFDPKAPLCEFEGWFGQPEASTSSQRFRLYPRVAEVQEEVAARSESLARRSKPLSRILPAWARSYSLADDTIFAASQPVNSAFAQLTGSKTLATRRWGSVSFSDMECLERLFLNQLEVTSLSLWLMSGILAMLKHLTRPYSTRPFPLSLLRCLVRPVLLLQELDSRHRSQGSVSSSAGSSCLSSLSTLRLPWLGLPVQGSMLWPLHGSAGLHQGHGSCFSYTPFSRYPYASIPRRLASPVFLSGVSPEGSSDCPQSVSRIGDCHQSLKVQPSTFPGCTVSWGRYRLHLFQGFSVSGTRHSAAVNSRRISILCLAYRELVAIGSRCAFFAGSPRSWRPAENAVPPALSPSFLEPSGYGGSTLAVDGVSSRSPVVAPSPSSLSAYLCTNCLQTFTFGQTPRTWVGAPISTLRSLQACGTTIKQRCLSTPGNC